MFSQHKSCGYKHNDDTGTWRRLCFPSVHTLGMQMLPLIKCKHVKWVERYNCRQLSESLEAPLMSGRNLGDVYIKGSAFVCATPSEFIKRKRRQQRTRWLRTWWVTVVHRRASENIYVGGKAVIIKFEEFMACKQPSNKPSEWDGVIHGATPRSTCLSVAIHGN